MKSKECSKCNETKTLEEFHKKESGKYGRSKICKTCNCIIGMDYRRTTEGLVSEIYKGQVSSSKRRGHSPPTYIKEDLKTWLLSQPNFKALFNNWVDSDYLTDLRPSIDRLDDYKGYDLNNIQLMTWKENYTKGSYDRRNGINNKVSKVVIQMDLEGKFIKEFHSSKQACRDTGIDSSSISKVCRKVKKHNTSGGFKWKYKYQLKNNG